MTKLDVIYPKSCQKMPELPDESIDFMPTDPPYGIGFMGKEWDKFNQIVNPQGAYEKKKGFRKLPRQSSAFIREFFTPIWKECFRVLKPGAFAFVMCIPRQDCLARQVISLEDAGFNVGFSPLFHAFAQGFPKSQNIGKAVDKRLGAERKVTGKGVSQPAKSGHFVGMTANNINKTEGRFSPDLTPIPATPQAQALDGSYAGFQPKPAVEVVIVAMKPLSEKTYVDQALKNGKGITWLGNGRIPYENTKDKRIAKLKNQGNALKNRDKLYGGYGDLDPNWQKQARFPANLLCSDDALNDGKSGHSIGHYSYQLKKSPYDGGWKSLEDKGNLKESNNSFSRYFSLDAWFDKKLKELPAGVQRTFPFLITPKPSKAEKNRGCEKLFWEKDNSSFGYHQIDKQRWIWLGEEEKRIQQETGNHVSLRARGNIHPTVKALKLFCYLITLGSREGDVIVDPFMGSGTTAVASKMLARHYVGWETGLENVKIARARLSVLEPLLI